MLVVTRHLQVTEEVLHALAEKAAVVALESTIIAHGFPYPESLSVAQALHDAVRGEGAVPAMIAIVRGEVRIGLDDELTEFIARGDDVEKCGVADIAAVSARGANGATTVSASITLAAQAGIKVFATGGLGGVHRQQAGGGNQPPDVSADLLALSRTPITVVSSGAKMLLDLPLPSKRLNPLACRCWGTGPSIFQPSIYRPAVFRCAIHSTTWRPWLRRFNGTARWGFPRVYWCAIRRRTMWRWTLENWSVGSTRHWRRRSGTGSVDRTLRLIFWTRCIGFRQVERLRATKLWRRRTPRWRVA